MNYEEKINFINFIKDRNMYIKNFSISETLKSNEEGRKIDKKMIDIFTQLLDLYEDDVEKYKNKIKENKEECALRTQSLFFYRDEIINLLSNIEDKNLHFVEIFDNYEKQVHSEFKRVSYGS